MKYVKYILLICLLFASCKSGNVSNITQVPDFDINQYLGTWYEIARLDIIFEKSMNNNFATYTLNSDGSLNIVNTGYNFIQHKWEKVTGKGKVGDESLKVSFFGPLYKDYVVISLDNSYLYAMVGTKNYEYLWILSRTTSIPESIKKQYVSMAKSLGYNTDDLIWTVHNAKK